jgi:hypothetical protein
MSDRKLDRWKIDAGVIDSERQSVDDFYEWVKECLDPFRDNMKGFKDGPYAQLHFPEEWMEIFIRWLDIEEILKEIK